MIHFNCHHCDAVLKVPDETAGKSGKCPKCGNRVTVPAKEAITVDLAAALQPSSTSTPPPPDGVAATPETKPCPFCGEQILAVAKKCKHCGEFLEPRVQQQAVAHASSAPRIIPQGDGVVVFQGSYEEAFAAMRETMAVMGGTIKSEDMQKGELEGGWRYGINAFGLRVAAYFKALPDGSIQVSTRGRFKDAIDTFGGARKKRDQVVTAFVTRFQQAPAPAAAGVALAQPLAQNMGATSPPAVVSGEIPHRGKTKGLAAILALLLGGLGIHKFYLGSWGWGLIYILLVWTWIPFIVAVVEAIIYLSMSQSAFDEKYNLRPVSPFTW